MGTNLGLTKAIVYVLIAAFAAATPASAAKKAGHHAKARKAHKHPKKKKKARHHAQAARPSTSADVLARRQPVRPVDPTSLKVANTSLKWMNADGDLVLPRQEDEVNATPAPAKIKEPSLASVEVIDDEPAPAPQVALVDAPPSADANAIPDVPAPPKNAAPADLPGENDAPLITR
jgi:hypothetical protein